MIYNAKKMVLEKCMTLFAKFRILQILHESYSSLSFNSFAANLCFNESLFPFVSSLLSKNTLRSPAKTNVFYEIAKFA